MWSYVPLVLAPCFLLGEAGGVRADESARQIVQKAINQHGGEEKLTRLLTYQGRGKGKVYLDGTPWQLESQCWLQLPDRLKYAATIRQGREERTFVRCINGDRAWLRRDGVTEQMTGGLLEDARTGAYSSYVRSLVPLLNDRRFTLASVEETTVGGHAAVGVKVHSKGQKDVVLYFDKESYLLVKSVEDTVQDDGTRVPLEIFYSEYKDIEGTKYPTRAAAFAGGEKLSDIETIELHVPDKIDPDVFAKP